jgi:hypothetical protein
MTTAGFPLVRNITYPVADIDILTTTYDLEINGFSIDAPVVNIEGKIICEFGGDYISVFANDLVDPQNWNGTTEAYPQTVINTYGSGIGKFSLEDSSPTSFLTYFRCRIFMVGLGYDSETGYSKNPTEFVYWSEAYGVARVFYKQGRLLGMWQGAGPLTSLIFVDSGGMGITTGSNIKIWGSDT